MPIRSGSSANKVEFGKVSGGEEGDKVLKGKCFPGSDSKSIHCTPKFRALQPEVVTLFFSKHEALVTFTHTPQKTETKKKKRRENEMFCVQ